MNPFRIGISALLVAIISASVWFSLPGDVVMDPNAAQVVLVAPAEVAPSQLVILDAGESTADSITWSCEPKTANWLVIDNGRRAVFSGASGEYLFIVAAAKGGSVDVKTHRIKITEGAPDESLKAKIAEWAEPIQSPSKRDDLIRLSQSFASIASAVEVGGLSPENILAATKTSNQAALGANAAYWQPLFNELTAYLQADAENLTDAPSLAAKWREISAALAEYSRTLPVAKKPIRLSR